SCVIASTWRPMRRRRFGSRRGAWPAHGKESPPDIPGCALAGAAPRNEGVSMMQRNPSSPDPMPRSRWLDHANSPLIIAEIGVNHDGSLARAKELVDIAADCGADAVKLQIFSASTLMN